MPQIRRPHRSSSAQPNSRPWFAGALILITAFASSTRAYELDQIEKSYALSETTYHSIDQSWSILSNSLLATRSAIAYTYNPTMASLIAGLKSWDFPRENSQWREAWLGAPPSEKLFFNKSVPVHIRKDNFKNPGKKTFVLFNSSYAVWGSGIWTNELAYLLDQNFDEPNLIIFSGFLSPEFLRADPKYPPINNHALARDLYIRLKSYIDSLKLGPADRQQIALIGSSGGATLVLGLLAEDAQATADQKLFPLGGMAFSPILDSVTTFQNFDSQVDENVRTGFGSDKTYSNNYWGAPTLLLPQGWQSILRQSATGIDNKYLTARFFNEFVSEDLKTLSQGKYSRDYKFGPRLDAHSGDRYRHYFIDYAFDRLVKADAAEGAQTFAQLTNMQSTLASINTRSYLVFSNDDPALSNPNYRQEKSVPAAVRAALDGARENHSIRVFNPEYGGHLGYFLDTAWLSHSLKEFFSTQTKSDNSQ